VVGLFENGLAAGLPTAETREGPFRWKGTVRHAVIPLLLIVGLVAVVAGTYWPVLSAQAISFDDHQYVLENPLVQNPSWTSARRFLCEVRRPSTVAGYYQPLAMISLMLDCAMGGRPDDFRQFHRTSLALHLVNTCLVMGLMYALFGELWIAAMVGLLFGLHPLHVEAVATVGERKTVLSPFFALLCLIVHVRYARRSSLRSYAACMGLYVLSLLSKPTSMPLPLLMLLLDYWPLGRLNRRAVIEKLPFFVVGAGFAVITVVSQGQYGAVPMPGDYPLLRVPLILCHNIVFYLWKIVFPVDLSVHYPFPEPLGLSNPAVSAGVVGTGLLILVLWASRRRTPAFWVGGLFFVVAILPTMGIVGFSVVLTSDKYVYLPLVGLGLSLSWVLGPLWSTRVNGGRVYGRRAGPLALVLILAAAEAWTTRRTLAPWGDSVSLFLHMANLAPRAVIVRNNLGLILAQRGRLDEAVDQYREALRVKPDYELAHRNLADALLRKGRTDEAIAHYIEALRINPNMAAAHFKLGNLLVGRGRLEEAIVHFRQTVRLNPTMPEAHNNLGAAILRQGKAEEAIEHFTEALRLKPDFEAARRNLTAARAR